MNTVLATNEVLEGKSIFELYNALAEAGMDGEDYKPLTINTMFFWDANLNRILQVDSKMKVILPTEYVGKTYDSSKDTWISLSRELFETKEPQMSDGFTSYEVSGYNGADVNVKISNKEELAYVFNYLNEEIEKNIEILPKSYTIDLGGNVIDMMGASININNLPAPNGWERTFKITNGTIKNVSLIDPTSLGDGKTEGHDGQYGAALISNVTGDMTLIIDSVDFYGIHVNNSNVSQAALLVGYTSTTADDNTNKVIISNVNIYNSSLLAHRSAGALIGNSAGERIIEISNVYMENVDVKTVGGRSAFLIGYLQSSANDISSSNITLKNCSFSLYECAQNTGTSPKGDTLGLQNDETVKSYYIDGQNGYKYEPSGKKYVKNALMLLKDQTSGNDYFKNSVTGWN